MPSSTSSSERPSLATAALPETHAPEVIEAPPYVRPVPALDFRSAGLVAVLLFSALLGGWEWYHRRIGLQPSTVNSDVLWAWQRARIDNGEGDATVLIGASRMLFNVQLDEWEAADGRRPIQLAMEGTSPMRAMEDLANDSSFTGRLLVGVAPDVFFSGFEYRAPALSNWRDVTLTQHGGQWLSMHLLEPVWAFLDPDFALFVVLARQAWPARAGVHSRMEVRKLSVQEPDRNTEMWQRLETDTLYRNHARDVWAQDFSLPPGVTQAMMDRSSAKEIDRAAAAVRKLQARGVPVVFVRFPSNGGYLPVEERFYPRARSWDVLLQRTGATGIHFADHPELQGYDLPEWSHMSASEARRFTTALHGVVARVAPRIVRTADP